MKQSERNGAEQKDAYPVKHGTHGFALRPRYGGRKRDARLALACLSLAFAASCEPAAPEGQVVASVDGTEITLREISEVMGATQSGEHARQQALDAVVARKLLAMEAEKRALQRTGDFHFALRHARETLLLEALRHDVRAEMQRPNAASIYDEIASHPWRYADRFALTLAYPGQSEPAFTIDSAEFVAPPPDELLTAEFGQNLNYGGRN